FGNKVEHPRRPRIISVCQSFRRDFLLQCSPEMLTSADQIADRMGLHRQDHSQRVFALRQQPELDPSSSTRRLFSDQHACV
ncbi:hypothetical protein WG66_013856, partial [Moniliophthora roreri]